MSTKLDIIVVGATGYTGQILCKYLAKHTQKPSWGIAGRNETKLKSINDLVKGGVNVPAGGLPMLTVDVTKPETLDAVCQRCKCVISCAGPFNMVGMPVVEACVRNGVHYVDSTGEFTFVRLVAERFHDEAQKKRIALVSCCGFDCVPSDLGNFVVHREAHEELREVKGFFDCELSGMSTGTAVSIANISKYFTAADASPTSLNPKGDDVPVPVAAPTRKGVWYDRAAGSWTAPFMMAACNERVVRRSNALMKSSAAYVESVKCSFASAVRSSAALYAMGLVVVTGPVGRYAVQRAYPAEVAYGPSEDVKKKSSFSVTFVGATVTGRTVTTTISANADPYDATGVFLAECALSALTLEKKGTLRHGVLTPATAYGDELVTRSRNAGISIVTTTETVEGATPQ